MLPLHIQIGHLQINTAEDTDSQTAQLPCVPASEKTHSPTEDPSTPKSGAVLEKLKVCPHKDL